MTANSSDAQKLWGGLAGDGGDGGDGSRSGLIRQSPNDAGPVVYGDFLFSPASGGTSATATGATLTETISFTPGTASGAQNATASGIALTETLSLIDGAATGQTNATANGATFTETISLIGGAASGQRNATAAGAILTVIESLTAGTATGQQNATASGAVVSFAHSMLSGNAQGDQNASAGGATLSQFYDLLPGSASAGQNGTADGFIGSVTYLFTAGSASASSAVVRRGDDGGSRRPQVTRERFWRHKAEEWLQDNLEALEGAVERPQRARRRLATRIIADVPDFVSEIPDLAPRVSAIETLAQRLLQPAPDYSAIAEAAAAQMALISAWKTMERRRRDVEALLILAA